MTALKALPVLRFERVLQPSTDIGKGGELKWLQLDHLFVDAAYQREVLDRGKRNIGHMVEAFNWALFGVVIVAKRGEGRYAVIDGQHRATAAKMHGGIKTVPCLILEGGQKAEARAFAAINNNVTRLDNLQAFRASVLAGDVDAIKLVDLCKSCGVLIAPYPIPSEKCKPGETLALGTLKNCLRIDGRDVLAAALNMLRAIDPEAPIPASAIQGTSRCLKAHPELRSKQPFRQSLEGLVQKARHYRATRGGTEWINFQRIITNMLTAPAISDEQRKRMMAGR